MIRHATDADTDAIVAMAERFYATTGYAQWADFDPVQARLLADLIRANGVLLVAEVDGAVAGMVGLIVGPSLCNAHVLVANEVMWWVNPEARHSGAGVALLDAVKPACIAKGAAAIQMVHLHDSPPQAAALYEQRGYRHTESSYTLQVN